LHATPPIARQWFACKPREGAKEFLKSLRNIGKAVPARSAIHLVLDNYATHKTPEVKAWLDKHPRFKRHFTPTSASWLNLVERFFAKITSRRIRRGTYSSVDDLVIPPFLTGCGRRTHAAIFSFMAGVMPPMPRCPAMVCLQTMKGMLGRSLL
jgi:transposase